MISQKIRFSLLALLFLTVSITTNVFSQNNIVIEDLSSNTNLPKGAINCLAQDNQGFIWIGTWKGLYRYDGYEVTSFSTINNNFNALKIQKLLISGDNLWVGTFVTGLYRIDLKTYKTSQYSTNSGKTFQLADNNIIALCELNDNKIAIGTERGGFSIINKNYEIEKNYTSESAPSLINNKQVSVIKELDNETIFIGNGMPIIFNIKTEEIKKITHPDLQFHIAEIAEISKTEFLIATLDKLFYLNIENGEEVKKLLDVRANYLVPNIDATENKILIGTSETILQYNISTKKIQNYATDKNTPIKLNVNQLLYTRNNLMLIGSEGGLYSLANRKKHFESIHSSTATQSPDIISSIEKSGNDVFIGTWGKGLFKLENNTLKPITFLQSEYTPQYIYDIQSDNNTIWFSCKNHLGIFRFNKAQKPYKLEYIEYFNDRSENNGTFSITTITKRKDNSILLGSWEGYLFTYNAKSDNFQIVKDENKKLPLSHGLSIFSIIEDNNGNLWVGMNGGGILRIKIKNNLITSQQRITSDDGLANNFVTTIFQSRNQKIWVGTEAGLTIIDNNTFQSVYNKDIIFDIQSIIEDPIGFLWIGTPKGLVRINSNHIEEPYKLFDKADGLTNNSFYLNSIITLSDYSFYFGGFNGIDYFTPYKIEYNYKKPIPEITNFSLFNENIYPCNNFENSPLTENIALKNELNLKYNQNTFSIEFSNLEYWLQEKCQYSYILEGVDKDWNYKDANHRTAVYTKLAPGNYKFLLKSTNNDGVWCDTPITLNINIEPPFWMTKLAYILYFIVAMVSIFLIVSNRLIKVQAQHKSQLREVEYRKQKELDEMKLRFFTNISHEFRTPLTLILGPLAKLLESSQNNPYKEEHLMIFRNASRLLQLTNRIIDFRKSEKEQLKLQVEKTNFSEFIYNIFLFFNYEAQKRNIAYRFKTTYEGNLFIDKEFIESITFNLLSNAFKYTADNQSILVSVFADKKGVHLAIKDTGKGMNTEEVKHIFNRYYSSSKHNSAGIGLSFTKRLIEQHKGLINVESLAGKGSTFTITLSDKDIYSQEEKSIHKNKETIVDWKKIDQSVQDKITNELTALKNIYNKDEMIVLVADDNFEVRQFLISLLENNFKVIEAQNGKDALEKAIKHVPDIIISDVMMPEMDGLELCKQIKDNPKTDHIPVILTTVLSSQTDRIKGLKYGADSYIPKPIDPNHLMIRVNKLIEKQLKLKDKFNIDTLSADIENEKEPQEEVHPLIEKARVIVLENIDNSEYNIDNFCEDLGLSRMQLYRKFKAITGMSANSFIRKVRLHKAAELLKTGNYTVKEITYDVGFIDLKYFRKCFNEEFGMNPSAYLKQYKKE